MDKVELIKFIKNKSTAAGGLFAWCVSTNDCYDIFSIVEHNKKNAEKIKR